MLASGQKLAHAIYVTIQKIFSHNCIKKLAPALNVIEKYRNLLLMTVAYNNFHTVDLLYTVLQYLVREEKEERKRKRN